MQVVPVLDIMNGAVVHAQRGQRQQYRPLLSPLAAATAPLDIARALRTEYGCQQIYVADLDAIMRGCPQFDVLRQLRDDGFSLLVDGGARCPADLAPLQAAGADQFLLAWESWQDPATLRPAVDEWGADRLIFSLDLQGGAGRGAPGWPATISATLDMVHHARLDRLLVLDLADVGANTGGSTQRLCTELIHAGHWREIWAGGGIRHAHDLHLWRQVGITALLCGTALFQRTLSRADLSPGEPASAIGQATTAPQCSSEL